MEQYSQYLMWVKSKNSILKNSFSHSWEEEAFAEDARGPLGGFVWPPRSYSCSFCRREFRSAQALGGHMNVHRRERAKLKQSLIDTNQNPNLPKSLLESLNPSFFPSPDSSSMASSIPILGQESTTVGSPSDAKSCVCDEVLVLGPVETNLYLGFDEEVTNCKRRKTVVLPMVIGSMEDQVDLELRLARTRMLVCWQGLGDVVEYPIHSSSSVSILWSDLVSFVVSRLFVCIISFLNSSPEIFDSCVQGKILMLKMNRSGIYIEVRRLEGTKA